MEAKVLKATASPSPGSPLVPLSPQRLNGTRTPGTPIGITRGLPQSPSLPNIFTPKHHIRTSSDVQGMVARFNSLDIKDHAEMRRKDEAALKRAQMGREEAEVDLRRAREDNRALKKDLEAEKEDSRTTVKRMEVVADELRRAKETAKVAQGMYEKEIRRARKEAFKAASALVKMQEELKSARNSLAVTRQDLELERLKVARREQDTFTAQYQLVGVQEELAAANARVKVAEEERDVLKTNLKEEEVARIAAEGRIALPLPANDEDSSDEFASPRKIRARPSPPSRGVSDKENLPPVVKAGEGRDLQHELDWSKRRLAEVEEQVEFMKMECQFQCCSCRLTEDAAVPSAHEGVLDEQMKEITATIAQDSAAAVAATTALASPTISPAQPDQSSTLDLAIDMAAVTMSRPASRASQRMHATVTSMTATSTSSDAAIMHVLPTATRTMQSQLEANDTLFDIPATTSHTRNLPHHHVHHSLQAEGLAAPEREVTPQPTEQPLPPQTPDFRTITTTTTIPLAATPASTARPLFLRTHSHDQPPTPSTAPPYQTQSSITPGSSSHSDPQSAPATAPKDYSAFFTPGAPLTREAAIEMLRERRGRARSFAATPKKGAVDGQRREGEEVAGRRDVSAPEVRSAGVSAAAKTPRSRSRGRPAQGYILR